MRSPFRTAASSILTVLTGVLAFVTAPLLSALWGESLTLVLPTLAAVVTGMLAGAFAASWVAGGRTPLGRFALAWAAVGVATLIVAALPLLVLEALWVFVLPGSVLFAVGLGWLPALAFVLAERRPLLALAPVGAAALVVALAIASVLPPLNLAGAVLLIGMLDDHRGEEDRPLPAWTPARHPVPTIDPAAGPVDPAVCRTDALRVDYLTGHDRAERTSAVVTATNVGAGPCVLSGYPDVAVGDERSGDVAPALAHVSAGAAPAAVRLLPGDTAVTTLGWGTALTDTEARSSRLWLAPTRGLPRIPVELGDAVGAGATLTVAAWRLPTRSETRLLLVS